MLGEKISPFLFIG